MVEEHANIIIIDDMANPKHPQLTKKRKIEEIDFIPENELHSEPIQVNHTSKTTSHSLLNHIVSPKAINPVPPIQKSSILQVQLTEKDKLIDSLQIKLQEQFDIQKEKNIEIEQIQERLATQEEECRRLQRIILEKFNKQAVKEEHAVEQNGQVHVQQIEEVNRLRNEIERLNRQKLCIVY